MSNNNPWHIPKIAKYSREHALFQHELEILWDMSLIHAPDAEVAHTFGFTIPNWIIYKTKNPQIQELINRARALGATNLRRAQFKSALEGNINMQIWLGRHVLNQGKEDFPNLGQPAQLSDISPEARQHLLELRKAIYETEPTNVIEIELAPVNQTDGDKTTD